MTEAERYIRVQRTNYIIRYIRVQRTNYIIRFHCVIKFDRILQLTRHTNSWITNTILIKLLHVSILSALFRDTVLTLKKGFQDSFITNQLDALISQNVILEGSSTCFGQFLCPSSGVFHCTPSNVTCHTGLLTACKRDQDGSEFQPDSACKLSENLYDICHCWVYSKNLLMMDTETVRNM
jgi:hypothetical protein